LTTNFCDNRLMRSLTLILLVASAVAQSGRIEFSHTTENLRGVSAISHDIAWASGTHGTYLRTTDAGRTWTPAQIPDATNLDFRAVVAFSADEAFLMSAGPGDQSRIYHTFDAGQHWQLQFTNTNPKGFFDSMAFWDSKHGIVLGDPIPDDSAKDVKSQLHFEILVTDDGQRWKPIPPSQLPPAMEGEGAFAASNTCIAILQKTAVAVSQNFVIPSAARTLLSAHAVTPADGLNSLTARPWKSGPSGPRSDAEDDGALAPESTAPDPNIWFATGGKAARVFHSADRGQTWQVFDTPILHGPDSAGIFSIAFRDALHGVIAGGDYKHPRDDGPDLAFTSDGGQTWTLSEIKPQAYFSAVAYDQRVEQEAKRQQSAQAQQESAGKKIRVKPVPPQRLFIIDTDFIFDFRPPLNPRRINGKKSQGYAFNAVSAFPEGGALIVGPKGTIVVIP
jgi:photosystem II stability/assembly factor-like uncharacterized protein